MSLIKIIKAQLGLSVTPANNFTLDASADNGTMKLARGNAGATTQDIMTVDALSQIDFPQMSSNVGGSPGSKGHITLPGGLIINWGGAAIDTVAADTWANVNVALDKPFPNGYLSGSCTLRNANLVSGQTMATNILNDGNASITVSLSTSLTALTGVNVSWIAIGY